MVKAHDVRLYAIIELFVTLHWTLAMMNNIMKPELRWPYHMNPPQDKPYHKNANVEILKRSKYAANKVKTIHDEVRNEFHRIRNQNF